MTKKRIVSLFAIFVLVTQFYVPAALAENKRADEFMQNFRLLDALGVTEYSDMRMEDDIITKGEFVSYAVKLSGYDGSLTEVSLPYSDVYKGHEYLPEISYAYSMKMFNSEWQQLYPDDRLTLYFATEVLKNMLGYNGPFESSSHSVVRKLTNGIVSGEYNVINLSQAYTMLCRAADIELVEQITYGNEMKYEISDETLLSKYHNIVKVSGRVDKTAFAAFDGKVSNEKTVCIDGEKYNTSFNDTTPYFGRYVDAYIYDINGDGIVKYIGISSKNEETVISAQDFLTFNGDSVTYTANNRTVTKKVDNPIIVYNGEVVSGSEYSDSLFDITDGSVTLIYEDSRCDLISIVSYENMLVSLVDSVNEVVYSKDLNCIPLEYSNADVMDVYAYNGEITEAASTESITAGSFITFCRSIGGKYVQIYLSSKMINSKITQIAANNDGKAEFITLENGMEYIVSKGASMSGIPELNVGSYYNIYINFLGLAGAFTVVGDDTNLYGFIAGVEEPGGIRDEVKYRIITTVSQERSGEMIFASAEKLILDGERYQAQDVPGVIRNSNSGSIKVPVLYQLNADNEIKYIDTPYYNRGKETEYSLTERNFGSKFSVRLQVAVPKGYTNLLGQRYFVPLNGLVVITPEGNDKEIRRMTRIPSKAVTANSGYLTENIKAYSLGKTTPICPIVVWNDNAADTESTSYEKSIFLVEKIANDMTEDEERIRLVLNNGKKSLNYYVDDEITISALDNLRVGDIIRVSFNSYEDIDGIEIMVSGADPYKDVGYVYVHNTAKENGNTPYLMAHEFRVAVGLVKSVEYDAASDRYYITYMLGDNPDDTADIESTYMIETAKSYRLSGNKGKIEISPISAGNIKTYDSVGMNADVIVVRYEFCVPITQYIITE